MNAGDVLGGRYRLLSPIGEGGMGTVWRAHQIQLDADVAVKVLHAHTAQRHGALTRFKREAKAAAALRSPHVVQIVDYGVDEATGTAFIAMELLDGESLARRLARERTLSPEETARWIAHAARAVARAHASGVVHRDLKPANIFIVENEDDELAKVLDFGIAKLAGSQPEETATASGALLGTPHYMSPEQIDPGRKVDFRTDLWSLAVIACECLTGRRPFEGDTLASLAMKIALSRSELPSSLGRVPRGFDAWFAKGTELDPSRRFGSALELATTLREVVDTGDSMVSEPSKSPLSTTQHEPTGSVAGVASQRSVRIERPQKRRAWALGVTLVTIAGALGGAAFWGRGPSSIDLTRSRDTESGSAPQPRSAGPSSLGASLESAAPGFGQRPDAGADSPPRETVADGARSGAHAEPDTARADLATPQLAPRASKSVTPRPPRAGTRAASAPKAAEPPRPKPAADPYDLL